MSLVTQIQQLATRIAAEIRDVIKPRLLPGGGTAGQILQKTSTTNYATGWMTPFSGKYADLTGRPELFSGKYSDLDGKPTLGTGATRNIAIGSTPPASPSTNDIWITDAEAGAGGGGDKVSEWPVFIAAWSGSMAVGAGVFTTLPIVSSIDSHNGFNAGTFIYMVPEDGIYEINAKLRLADNVANFSHGLGCDTANQDSPTFLWKNTEAGGSGQQRNGHFNNVTSYFAAGAQLRLFTYLEQASTITATALTIARIR